MMQIADFVSSAGVAAVVSAILTFIFKPLLEHRLQKSMSAKLEAIRAAYVSEHEYLKEIIKKNSELYPTLIESVYRSRNIARELNEQVPKVNPALRSELGTHALALTEGLYRARLFLSPELFEQLHEFKRILQKFVFDCDILTSTNPQEGVRNSMRDAIVKLDRHYENAVSIAQARLKISSRKIEEGSP